MSLLLLAPIVVSRYFSYALRAFFEADSICHLAIRVSRVFRNVFCTVFFHPTIAFHYTGLEILSPLSNPVCQ